MLSWQAIDMGYPKRISLASETETKPVSTATKGWFRLVRMVSGRIGRLSSISTVCRRGTTLRPWPSVAGAAIRAEETGF